MLKIFLYAILIIYYIVFRMFVFAGTDYGYCQCGDPE